MELKSYQQDVLADLSRFLDLLNETQNSKEAYRRLWEERGVPVADGGKNGMAAYRIELEGVPEVCLKVPTGGGKTFIAANAVRRVFNSMPARRVRAVAWLVPSDAILTQTHQALSTASHPYRQQLNLDFSGRVEVYTKQELLNGQNFNPVAVTEQLSVFVLSYDSFRTKNKEGRKAYQENGNLAPFARFYSGQEAESDGTSMEADATALIQVIRRMNPMVIVDESHHAQSELSREMLANFNPCFVLELTATPKEKSNVISFVDAVQLKREHMVKLPVIVYNRRTQGDVYADAISIREKLERAAASEKSGAYIRPIALFQAQPKNSTDSATYQKIRDTLVDAGIPEAQIAIKTADWDELRGVDLLSQNCPVRFIITVNALKEGWDCPFAYVLATVANRSSPVDVEQILGRVLRLPHARKNKSEVLNLSYVITSSADFYDTLERVVAGLNNAGFSSRDYRAEDSAPAAEADTQPAAVQLHISPKVDSVNPLTAHEIREANEDQEVDVAALKARVAEAMKADEEHSSEPEISDKTPGHDLLAQALVQNAEYEAEMEKEESGDDNHDGGLSRVPVEVREKMEYFAMREEYRETAQKLILPQFMIQKEMLLLPLDAGDYANYEIVEPEDLTTDFTLRNKDTMIDFSTMNAQIGGVDVGAKGEAPRAWKLSEADSLQFKKWFGSQPSAVRMATCRQEIFKQLSLKNNCISDGDLRKYVERVVEDMDADQLGDMEQSPFPYFRKIQEKINALLTEHRRKRFELLLNQGKIICRPSFRLRDDISPVRHTAAIAKSLYAAEEDMNGYERDMVMELSGMDNLLWWHRNIAKREFQINGPLHAYPDFIAMTQSGKVLMIEAKGDHLDNADSREKAWTGDKWASAAGGDYRYYMVFQQRQPGWPGTCNIAEFKAIARGL